MARIRRVCIAPYKKMPHYHRILCNPRTEKTGASRPRVNFMFDPLSDRCGHAEESPDTSEEARPMKMGEGEPPYGKCHRKQTARKPDRLLARVKSRSKNPTLTEATLLKRKTPRGARQNRGCTLRHQSSKARLKPRVIVALSQESGNLQDPEINDRTGKQSRQNPAYRWKNHESWHPMPK